MQLGLFVVFQKYHAMTDEEIMCSNALYCVLVQRVFFLFLRIYRSTQGQTRWATYLTTHPPCNKMPPASSIREWKQWWA